MKKNVPYWLCNKGTICSSDHFEDGTIIHHIAEVQLIKLKDGRYQFSQDGVFKRILHGYDYTLIDRKIGAILKAYVPDQIEIADIVIFRRATNEEWSNYCELKMKHKIDYTQYQSTESSGLKIYSLLDNLIYISPDLKHKIEEALEDISDIEFKRGVPAVG